MSDDDHTRRLVLSASATTLLGCVAGCQTAATSQPDGRAPIKNALREHYGEIDNLELVAIDSVALRSDNRADARVRVRLNGGDAVTTAVVVTHASDRGWAVDGGAPAISEAGQ